MNKSIQIIILIVFITFTTLISSQSYSSSSNNLKNYLYSIYETNQTNQFVSIYDFNSKELSNVTIDFKSNLDIYDFVRVNEDGNIVLLMRDKTQTNARAMYEVDVKTGDSKIIGESIPNQQYFEYEFYDVYFQGNIGYSFYNNDGTKLMLGIWNFETGVKSYISLANVDEELKDTASPVPGFNYKDGTMYIAYLTAKDTTNVITLNPNDTKTAPVLYKDVVGLNATIAKFLYVDEIGQLYAACYTLEINNTGSIVKVDLESLSAETVLDNIPLGSGDWKGIYYTPVSLSGDLSSVVFVGSGLTNYESDYKMSISVYDLSGSTEIQSLELYNYWLHNETNPDALFFRFV